MPNRYEMAKMRTDQGLFIDKGNQVFDIRHSDYGNGGAKGDGVADDTAAIRAAFADAIACGGGKVLIPDGYTFLMSTVDSVSLPIPVSGADFATASSAQKYHVYLNGADNISVIGGGTLKSTLTTGDIHPILCNGVRNFSWDGPRIESVTAWDGSDVITTAGCHGLSFTSTARNSHSIRIRNYEAYGTYTGVYVFGDAASSFRVRGIRLSGVSIDSTHYGIACHNNGDDISYSGVRCADVNARPVFLYGVSGHRGEISIQGTGNNTYGPVLIKAYDRDTSDIRLKVRTTQATNADVYKVNFSSQHAPGVQAAPKRVYDCDIHLNDIGDAQGGSFYFSLFEDAEEVTTSANGVFDNIRLSGNVERIPVAGFVQANDVVGVLNIDDLVVGTGNKSAIFADGGFVRHKRVAFVPALKFDGVGTGIAYHAETAGEYIVAGHILHGWARVKLTSKGASTGVATLDLPLTLSTQIDTIPVITGAGIANMVDMVSPITGYISNAINLQMQDATAVVGMDNTNFSDTSEFYVQFSYPI